MTHIDSALLDFLASPHLRVAILKGEWGVGKTHFWKSFLERNRKVLKFRAYAYVSLFGARDISDLKQQILSGFEMLDQEILTRACFKIVQVEKRG